ncbi:hypothetical protein OG884_22595 [Streptosporangium sp. NBC_01755]|uniref:hypothetical protein n=1 Tax=unclassified Streptosporangium TaxID=2632669 RepID=UPI002DDAC98D|nr:MULTISPECIES: hypothetical protein [unclassified Streptosporangium]WSA24247.1 hypothetical protein OIE13_25325 [Streptosporangium sp. NBC_01810]WSC97678.1 hypothetical protein OG884_22595 [Streptosporangium sp. NBC_01755]
MVTVSDHGFETEGLAEVFGAALLLDEVALCEEHYEAVAGNTGVGSGEWEAEIETSHSCSW